MIVDRLKFVIGPLHHRLFGFTKGKGTREALCTIRSQMSMNTTGPRILIVVDVLKAFESMNREAVLDLMVMYGVEGQLLGWIQDYLSDRHGFVSYQGEESETLEFKQGVPMGGILGPYLMNLCMHYILDRDFPEGVTSVSYADDLILDVSGGHARQVLDKAQVTVDTVEYAGIDVGVQFAVPKKAAAMAMQMTVKDSDSLKMYGRDIPWVNSHICLGVIFDKHMKFKEEIMWLKKRAMRRVNILKVMAGLEVGVSQEVLQTFYTQGVRSIIDYAAPMLAGVSEKLIYELEKVQNCALRTILGAPRWTKILAMQQESGVPALKFRIKKVQAMTAIKAITAPEDSILARNIEAILEGKRVAKPDKNWLFQTCETFRNAIDIEEMLEWGRDMYHYDAWPPWVPTPGMYVIDPLPGGKGGHTPEVVKAHFEEQIDYIDRTADLIVYTDGSVKEIQRSKAKKKILIEWNEKGKAEKAMQVDIESGEEAEVEEIPVDLKGNKWLEECSLSVTGAAYIILPKTSKAGIERSDCMIKTNDNCSSMQTELIAIFSALSHIYRNVQKNLGIRVVIHTDSLSSLKALQQRPPKHNRYLISSTQRLLNLMENSGYTVILHYIASHVGIKYNEEVDKLATKALDGADTRRSTPPSINQYRGQIDRFYKYIAKQEFVAGVKESRSVPWRILAIPDTKMPRNLTRKQRVCLNRVRLGYRANWEIGRECLMPCIYCKTPTGNILAHYVLECANTHALFGTYYDIDNSDYMDIAAQRIRKALTVPTSLIQQLEKYPVPR